MSILHISCNFFSVESNFQSTIFVICKLLLLPNTTHGYLIPLVCDDLPVLSQLHGMFMKSFPNAMRSNNKCLHLCAVLVLKGSCSAARNNVNFISHSLILCRQLTTV